MRYFQIGDRFIRRFRVGRANGRFPTLVSPGADAQKNCGLSRAGKIESLSKVDQGGEKFGWRYIIVFSEY